MEIKTEENKKELKVEVIDGDETLINLLVSKLKERKGVEFASYAKAHPLTNKIYIVIKANENPKNLVIETLKAIKSEINELRKLLPSKGKEEKKKVVKEKAKAVKTQRKRKK